MVCVREAKEPRHRLKVAAICTMDEANRSKEPMRELMAQEDETMDQATGNLCPVNFNHGFTFRSAPLTIAQKGQFIASMVQTFALQRQFIAVEVQFASSMAQ